MECSLDHDWTKKDSFFNPRYLLAQDAIQASKNYHCQAMKSIHHLNMTRVEKLDFQAPHDCIVGGPLLRMLGANRLASVEFADELLQDYQNSFRKYPVVLITIP